MNIYENRLEIAFSNTELLDLPYDLFLEQVDLSLELIFGDE